MSFTLLSPSPVSLSSKEPALLPAAGETSISSPKHTSVATSELRPPTGESPAPLFVLDVETTGLDPIQDRVISVGLVEIVGNQIATKQEHFFNPGSVAIDEAAFAVHGISSQFLADKPPIKAFLPVILGMLHQATVVGHHIEFDLKFLDEELRRHRFPLLTSYIAEVVDTLKLSKERFPGRSASLDALCDRLGIPHKHREKHGALIDAELAAEAYLAFQREQQQFDFKDVKREADGLNVSEMPDVRVLGASDQEIKAHQAYLEGMKAESNVNPIWDELDESGDVPSP